MYNDSGVNVAQDVYRPVAPDEAGAVSVADDIVAVGRPLPLRSAALLPYQRPQRFGLPMSPDGGPAYETLL